jgi:hypothetical protein
MPNLNGMGPNGLKGLNGRSMGHGMGRGRGFGRRLGWFGVGYGHESEDARAQSLRGALEQRVAYLRAELERTESLLKAEPKEAVSEQEQAR